jgi:acetyl/propionyl-CoA carboxylase alpha subunit
MKLSIEIDGEQGHVEILAPAPDCRFRLDDGAERRAGVEVPEPCVYSVLMDGRSYEARVEEGPGALVVLIDGRRFEIEVRDPRRLTRKSGGAADGVQTVAAPMPGKIVRVLVAAGDDVTVGQGLLVVEAMKMQNEMKASRAGRVLSMSARPGATVTAGEVLATIG